MKQVRRAPEGSTNREEAQRELDNALAHRKLVDESVAAIGKHLFGAKEGPSVLKSVRPAGKPLVDDWDCLKSLVSTTTIPSLVFSYV